MRRKKFDRHQLYGGRIVAATHMLIPSADGPMDYEMRQALAVRQELIEQCAIAVLDTALDKHKLWTTQFAHKPTEPRKQAKGIKAARIITAYRDRYQISGYPTTARIRAREQQHQTEDRHRPSQSRPRTSKKD